MNILLYCCVLVTGEGAINSYLYAPNPVVGCATVICPAEGEAQDATATEPVGKANAVGADTVAVPVTGVPHPSVMRTVYAPWFNPVNILLKVFAILLPWGARMAAPGLISSKLNGPKAEAPGVTVRVPLAGVMQLVVAAVVNVGAVEAGTVKVVMAEVLQASVILTVYVPGGRFAKALLL